jgi:hypothetical protein
VINCYVFKRWFIYLGFIIIRRVQKPILYADNRKTVTLSPELELSYIALGFSKKRIKKKLQKWLIKHREELENHKED